MLSKDYLMMRSAQRARLEARTAPRQLIFWCNQFPDSLESGGPGNPTGCHDAVRMQPCVYILASHRNGTLYIGVTSDLGRRASDHRRDLYGKIQ